MMENNSLRSRAYNYVMKAIYYGAVPAVLLAGVRGFDFRGFVKSLQGPN
jgi:hypothetical protein